jgi:glycosyltransferase involved in cell wall biosynthesis
VAGDAAVLVDPRNVTELADALRNVLTDAALRTRLRAAALERAPRFMAERMGTEMARVYAEVCAA